MPSFSDSIFLFVLALLLFGPKKLPVLARELGKWIGEFRRASNEFKMQMEEELRLAEQQERTQKIAEMEAAAPVPPPLPAAEEIPEPVHPHLPGNDATPATEPLASTAATSTEPATAVEPASPAPEPLPIATSGELKIMPPSTGLPLPQGRRPENVSAAFDNIPSVDAQESANTASTETETAAHG